MLIHCMYCGHSIELSDAYNDFQGPLRCMVCKGLMQICLEEGELRFMEPPPTMPVVAPKPHTQHTR